MRSKYIIKMRVNDKDVCFPAKTYRDIANAINAEMGFQLVSTAIVVNWLSRGKKAPKYDFIKVVHTSMY